MRVESEVDPGVRETEVREPSTSPIKEYGEIATPAPPASNIHVLSIVGQIEGHMVLPPQNKTTKYEHIMPQLVAIEQSSEIEGLLILLRARVQQARGEPVATVRATVERARRLSVEREAHLFAQRAELLLTESPGPPD